MTVEQYFGEETLAEFQQAVSNLEDCAGILAETSPVDNGPCWCHLTLNYTPEDGLHTAFCHQLRHYFEHRNNISEGEVRN